MSSTPPPADPRLRRQLEPLTRIEVPGARARGRARLRAARAGPPPRRGRMAVMVGAAAVAALVVWWTRPIPPRLFEGEVLVAARGTRSSGQVGDRARLELRGPGMVTVTKLGEKGEVELRQDGGVLAQRVRSKPGVPYVVRTGLWTVRALGTVFEVHPRGQDLEVEVREGRVSVEGPGVRALLEAPRSAIFRPVRPDPRATPAPFVLPRAGPSRSETPPPHEGRSATEERLPAAGQPSAERNLHTEERLPAAGQPSAERNLHTEERLPAARRPPPAGQPSGGALASPPEPARAVPPKTPSPGALPSPIHPPDPLEPVRALVSVGRWSAAARALRALPDREGLEVRQLNLQISIALGEWEEVAREAAALRLRPKLPSSEGWEAAYWQAEALRRRARWAAALRIFSEVAQSGRAAAPERAEDAAWSIAWCLSQLGRFEDARAAVLSYLAIYPEGRFHAQAQAWLEKDR